MMKLRVSGLKVLFKDNFHAVRLTGNRQAFSDRAGIAFNARRVLFNRIPDIFVCQDVLIGAGGVDDEGRQDRRCRRRHDLGMGGEAELSPQGAQIL